MPSAFFHIEENKIFGVPRVTCRLIIVEVGRWRGATRLPFFFAGLHSQDLIIRMQGLRGIFPTMFFRASAVFAEHLR